MPDQFGNPTPQEVLAGIAQQNQQMVAQAQTPDDRRLAQLYTLGRQLTQYQDPEVQKAQRIQNALGKSMALERNEGESTIDFEIRRATAMYSDLRNVDDASALQVANRVLELEQEKAEQVKLTQQEARSQEQHDAQMKSYKYNEALHNAEGLRYAFDPKTGASVPGLWAHVNDLTSAVDQAEWQARGLIPVDRQQLFSLTGQAGDAEAHRGILNNSGVQAHLETASNYVSQALLGKEIISGMADALEAGANPTTGAEKFAVAAQSLVNTFDEVRRSLHIDANTGLVDPNFRPTPRPDSPEFAEDMATVQRALNERNIKTAIPTSFLTLYIYSVAKTQDARVTNMDFENIASTLRSVAGDPSQIAKIMIDQTDVTRRGLALTSREMATRWVTDHPRGTEAYQDGELILGPLNNGDMVLDEMRQEAARLEGTWKKLVGGGSPSTGRARVVGENR